MSKFVEERRDLAWENTGPFSLDPGEARRSLDEWCTENGWDLTGRGE